MSQQESKFFDEDNILPEFDPSTNKRTDIWLNKVNECVYFYGWDEERTIYFALQKLQGPAKIWYEKRSLNPLNWAEWQEEIVREFPCQNYGEILEDMLRRKSRDGEPFIVYFHEKLALLDQCEIFGKNAVDCLIHGLSDKSLQLCVSAQSFTQPEELLKFLMSLC